MSVRVEHLSKSFGRLSVLTDVSLSVPAGQVLALLGPNGAGKSTLIKILMGLYEPASGRVEVPSRIGYLPEQNPLYDDMYVLEYLRFMASLTMRGVPRREQHNRVADLVERVGLTPEVHKRIRVLSKGYRQRVGLAQALLGDPELLVLDEPTTGLDVNQLQDIRALIRDLRRDRTVILSTHIMQEVREMCDRVVILSHGCVAADTLVADVPDLEQLFRDATLQ